VWVNGGTFLMGSDCHYPEEAPAHRASVDGFWMDRTTVTNADFTAFVDDTGYITVAERPLEADLFPGADPSTLVPGALVFTQPQGQVDLRDVRHWWQFMPGACWRNPEGPGSAVTTRGDHPVVQVCYEDAVAYATWSGKCLPTEAEWEYAARGGLECATYVWGNEFTVMGKQMANTWQGQFPSENLVTDGFDRTAPVKSFPPNGYGLYEMAGNVWEWTTDWYFDKHAKPDAQKACCVPLNPRGPSMEHSFDPSMPGVRIPRKVLKGGSFLCAPNYCLRYRPAARSPQMVDTGTSHIGFRCIIRRPQGAES
jgi:formylglycine-generating enzyme